ncbi:MAG: signal peptidase I [Fimbriimonadaceae bacterium]
MAQHDLPPEPAAVEAEAVGAAEETKPSSIRRKTLIYTGFGGFLLFLLVCSVFFYVNFKTIEVQGDSMEPTLHPGQRLLISKAYWLVGEIQRGDIVVIQNPYEDEVIIKRVYRVGGESVDFQNVPSNWDLTQGDYFVPKGSIYVLGDNIEVSQDSRAYGPFENTDVIGKVVVVHSAIGSSEESGDE